MITMIRIHNINISFVLLFSIWLVALCILNVLCLEMYFLSHFRDRHGRDRKVVDLQLPMQSVSINTDVVSSNFDQGEVHNIM